MTARPSDMDLAGKAAVVTGAARGLGRAFANSLAAFGATVVLVDRNAAALAEAVEMLSAEGRPAIGATYDVRSTDEVDAMVAETVARYGAIHILVNNVGGIYLGRDIPPAAPFIEQNEDAWEASYALNLKTVFLCTSRFGRLMVQQGTGGSIINIASSEALRAAPNYAPYAAFKAAVVNFTRTMALELAPYDIRVNCVAPDAVPTESLLAVYPELAGNDAYARHVPLGRAGVPDDIAGLVTFLASDAARFITGTTIPVEGGMLAAGGWLRHPTAGWTTDVRLFEQDR